MPDRTSFREQDESDSTLTRRESEVATLLMQGMSYQEIADKLCVSYHTVNSHVKSILRKLGITSCRKLASVLRQARARIATDEKT